MYNVYLRDSNYRRIGEITNFTKLDLIPRFNDVGTFVLDVPTDSQAAKELIKPQYGIIVKKDGKTTFSGTVKSRQRQWDASGDTLTLSGKDDNEILTRRIAYPDISGDFTKQAYDVRTGKAETVMKQYIDFNIGPGCPVGARRALTIQADTGLGSTITGRARFQTLLELSQSLALKGGGLGFRVLQVDDHLEFQVYQPIDKTRSAFFSPLLGNLSSFEYSNDDPLANMVFVGAQGEGESRKVLWKQDNTSTVKFGRSEIFVDQRDTNDDEELSKSLDESLTNNAEQNSFTFQPIDTPQLAFGLDYSLGDKVSIVLTQPNEVVTRETIYSFISFYQTTVQDITRIQKFQDKLDVIQDIVREVKISIAPEGESISPVVGTSDSNNNAIKGIFDKMKNITKRLNKLERV